MHLDCDLSVQQQTINLTSNKNVASHRQRNKKHKLTHVAKLSYSKELNVIIFAQLFKGTVSRDFRPSVFFMNQSHLGH
jgi:hypothetical protein